MEEVSEASNALTSGAAELANTTHDSALHLNCLANKVNAAVKDAEDIHSYIEKTNASSKAGINTEAIVDKILTLTSNIDSINEDKKVMLKSINTISNISEESAASTEQVTASIQQQFSSIHQVNTLTDELKGLVDALNKLTNLFKVN